ncbi:hypothetical protein PPERSA_00678 [Pseudocohnilembus persalinus]|uniref:Transmembrane protein n=1 Tax=Pseudocohnilembus persalinus TaxID=266149 RepID=A0A0V0QT72_PSEPJ|nr:hypothetical protein PPERSA_00678 [Pseudocohnilembus persalinus]|eukprot:KRX05377.1 hypothetical protein PPERSA_00678 [Pseudocohnilembus persalinus]
MKLFIIFALLLIFQRTTSAHSQRNLQQSQANFSFLTATTASNWNEARTCFDEVCNWDDFYQKTHEGLLLLMTKTKECDDFLANYQANLDKTSTAFPVDYLLKCIKAEPNLSTNQQYMSQCYCECGGTNCYYGNSVSVASYLACERTQCNKFQFSQNQLETIANCVSSDSKCVKTLNIYNKLYDYSSKDLSILYTDLPLKEHRECADKCFEQAGVNKNEIQCSYNCMDNTFNLSSNLMQFCFFALILLVSILI